MRCDGPHQARRLGAGPALALDSMARALGSTTLGLGAALAHPIAFVVVHLLERR